MNFLESLVDQAKKKKQQLGSAVHDVFDANTQADQQRRVAAAQPRYYQQQQARLGNPSALYKLGTGIGLGAVRSGTGFAQGVTGLYDLATPGHGTNRVSQSLDRFAKNTDQTAQNEGINPMLYKGSQLGTDALSFAVGAGELKLGAEGAMQAPRVAKFATPFVRGTEAVHNVTVNPLARLEAKGLGGRVAAKTARGAIDPGNNAANLAFTAKYTGEQASKGRDISPQEVGKNLAMGTAFNVGVPLAGALGQEAGIAGRRAVINSATKTVNAGQKFNAAIDKNLTPKQFNITPEDHSILTDYHNMMNSRHLPDQGGYAPGDVNVLNREARRIQAQNGVKLQGSNPAETVSNVENYLQAFADHQQNVLQGGAALGKDEGSMIPTIRKAVGVDPEAPKGNRMYKTVHQGGKAVEVPGEPVKIADGLDTFVHKDENGNWVVSEATSGRSLTGGGYPNQHHAIAAARSFVRENGADTVKARISEISGKTPTPVQQDLQAAGIAPDSRVTTIAPKAQPVEYDPNFNPNTYVKEQSKAQQIAYDKNNPSGAMAKFNTIKSDAKRRLVDSYAPIEDTLNRAEKAGAKIAPSQNIKYQIDRVLRANTIAGQYIKDNGLDKIVQGVKNTNEFDQYLIARHAADVKMQGIKTGRNAAKDEQLVQALGGKYKAQAEALDTYSQKLLDKSVEYGLISKDLAQHLKELYPHYVPMQRVFSEIEQAGIKGNGKGVSSISTQSIVQRLKGSEREIASPLNSIIEKTNDVVEQGERNKAASILASYKDIEGNPFGLKELKSTETVGTRPVISYLENGKVKRFETTKEIADAAKNMNKEQIGFIGQVFAVPTRVLRLGATGVNVGFTLANISKDIASGFINSKHGYTMADPRVFLTSLKAATLHGSKEYAELVREGAGGTSFDIARNAKQENIRTLKANRNKATQLAYTVTRPAQLLRAVEDTIGRGEEFGRALQYYGNKRAFARKGFNESDTRILAADAARSNTTNFARAGDYGRAANMLLPYLNAGIQGSRTFVRNVKDRPIQTGAKVAMTAFVPMAALTAWNLGDPKRREAYNQIQDYEKEGNFILLPPNPKKDPKTGRWNAIKVPMSQEIANLNNVVRNGVEAMAGDKSFDFAKMAGSLLGTATSLQADNGTQAIAQVVPQAIKPGVETITNTNLYSGNKIVPDKLRNLDKQDQVGQYTSGTARIAGKLTGQSPLVLDNAIKTGAGGAGQNVINLSDKLLAQSGAINKDSVQGKPVSKSITDRFAGAQSVSDYQIADKSVQQKLTELRATPEFKAMSTDDKAAALNRLEGGARDAYYQTDKTKVSSREAGLKTGETSVKDYLTTKTGNGDPGTLPKGMNGHDVATLKRFAGMSADDKDKVLRAEPNAEYSLKIAEYERNKKLGKYSPAELVRAKKDVDKAKVSSTYPKDVRELFGLNKTELYDFLSTDKNGNGYAKQIIALDDALTNAGLQAKNKFRDKYGNEAIKPKDKKSGGGGGRSKSITTLINEFKLPYDTEIKNRTKGAQLARSAGLAKKA